MDPIVTVPVVDMEVKKAKRAKVGFILGIISIIAWIIPIIGLPVTVCAIVFSSLGLNSEKRTKAIWGLVLGIVFVCATLLNAVAGVMIAGIEV